MMIPSRFAKALPLLVVLGFATASATLPAADSGMPWWKGNLHTHSLWSDGDDYPEMITDWFKEQGYNFLMLSDHNTFQAGERWIDVENNKGGEPAFNKYLARFGGDWVETREHAGTRQVRLKTLAEFHSKFDEPGRFLMIQGEEITAQYLPGPGKRTVPIHVNGTNLQEPIIPQSGDSVVEVMEKNVQSVIEQRNRLGLPMFPHLNHPNFHFAVTAEQMMQVTNEHFFEVYNGHPSVYNKGDELHAGTERIWDIVLTKRLAELHTGPVYGLATDDSHNYHELSPKRSNAGRGWVMVHTYHLTPDRLVEAMLKGDFYASSGVTLTDTGCDGKTYRVKIAAEPDVEYTTYFIGTLRGYSRASTPVVDADSNELTRRYSDEIGTVLAVVKGEEATYKVTGSELYVRARVESTKVKENTTDETETAWTQPWVR